MTTAQRGAARGEHGTQPLAAGGRSASPRRRRARRVLTVGLALVIAVIDLAIASLIYLSRTATSYPASHFNQGENAVWLEHTWVGDAHSEADYDALAARLEREQIRYVFVHSGPLDSDGSVPADRYAHAGDFLDALRSRDPGVLILAWLGQVERASGLPASETVDLGDPDTRQRIAAAAAYFAGPLGFDGVHYDIEPMLNNGPHFLDLLDVTRAALPAGKLLSISAPMWAPDAHLAEWLRSTLGKGAGLWTSYYYAAVAAHVDQMVAMEYNTAIPIGPLYTLYVKEETQHILAAARSARHPPQVLIALPTYHDNGFWFHDAAENLGDGLPGVAAGLNSGGGTQPFGGVAVYRYGTTADRDWATYERVWLGR